MMTEYYDAGDIDLDEEVVLDHNGKRISEARAQEWAEYTMREYWAQRGGRPSLSGGQTHSPQVSFRVPEQTRERAVARAEAEGVTVSELARRALEQLLDA
jgi:predicted HicB family RNase H-like nuclease